MIFAFVTLALGVAVPFLPGPVRPFVMVAALVSGILYVRAMNRRARADEQAVRRESARLGLDPRREVRRYREIRRGAR